MHHQGLAGEGQLAGSPFFPAPNSGTGVHLRALPLHASGCGRGFLPTPSPPAPSPPSRGKGTGRGVLTSALTSASSAAAPRPRQPRSTSSSGSSRGRAAASRPLRRLPAQPGRPGALRSLPMLPATGLVRGAAARAARPLAGSTHAARKLATLPGSPPGGREADLPVPATAEPLRFPR